MQAVRVLDILELPEIGFVGCCTTSASGEWIVGWGEVSRTMMTDGNSQHGPSKACYVLYNTRLKSLAAYGELGRPAAGHVANNGTFCIEDWMGGEGLQGAFCIFTSTGTPIIRRSFRANLNNSAIADSGRLAVCQTCNADSDDGNCLTGFDVECASELFSIHPPTGWASAYHFLDDPPQFGVVCDDVGTFFYNAIGELLHPEQLREARLAGTRPSIALWTAKDLLDAPEGARTTDTASRVLATCERLLRNCDSLEASTSAMAYRLKGHACEQLGRVHEAVAAYAAALSLDPGIGVKRRLQALQRHLKAPTLSGPSRN